MRAHKAPVDASRYANVFNIGHNAFEFVLEFGQQLSEAGRVSVHTSIVTLPVYAQALSRALDDSLERYEAQFGHISDEQEQVDREQTDREQGP